MCGIIGSIGQGISEEILSTLRHRGPDDYGLELIAVGQETIGLGHARLSIIDLSPAGHQPMQSRDGRWWVVFNGEIYNHLELRKTLAGPFRGHSDTETLVELLAAQGIEKTLPQLNGMFAFAALDTQEGKLHLARDPFGIKPVYYFHQGGRFAFASEVRALKAMGLDCSVDEAGLRQFLTLRYVPSPRTLWQGIERLPPGHLLTVDLAKGTVATRCFIEPVKEQFSGTLQDAVAAYRDVLFQAVRRQLLSDVPVGVLLSGGIDSALVAAMAKDAGRELPCFTVGFGGGHRECEIDDAQETAQVLGLPFYAVTVTPDDLRAALPRIVRAVEEPLGTTSIMPMWYLVRRAREKVTVVLTGQGSDEPWGGYFRYQMELLRQRLPWPSLWWFGQRLAGLWRGRPEAVERGLRALAQRDAARRIVEACALFPAQERRWLLGNEGDGGAEDRVREWLAWLDGSGDLTGVERTMRLDARMNLADDLLLYGDKISMAVSLEARVPMLDLELVRFVEALPVDYRIRWRQSKIVHKRMAERYLPARIVHRKKRGFQVPFGDWSRGIWKAWVEEMLLSAGQPHFSMLNRQGIETLWKEHLTGKPDRSRQIFALLMLVLWWREND